MTTKITENFSGRAIAVVGMARSGLAAADVLSSRGGRVTLCDTKSADDLREALQFASERAIPVQTECEWVGPEIDLVVTSPGVRRNAPILVDAVRRGLPVWGEIEAAYRIAQAPILAITGTNGKTTTAALVGEIFRSAGFETYVAGNIAAGEIALPLIRAADTASPQAVIVAEISSFQLEWIDRFKPKIAAITNITSDHSDRQSWDEYVAAKWRITANQDERDTAVLRSDVPLPEPFVAPRSKIVWFDRLPRPDWLTTIRLPGEHNRENVMTALAIASAFGVAEETARPAIAEFAGVVHRLEHVATIAGVRWFNNSMCTNNDAFARSLGAIDGDKVVIAGGVFKGGDTGQFAAAAADRSVRALVCFGQSGEMLAAAATGAGSRCAIVVETLGQAVERAREIAGAGASVLLCPACASFDQFRDFEDRGTQFKEMVRRLETSA